MKKIRIIVMVRIISQNVSYIYIYILSQSESKRNLQSRKNNLIRKKTKVDNKQMFESIYKQIQFFLNFAFWCLDYST